MSFRPKVAIAALLFAGFTPASAAPSRSMIVQTEKALVEQISCKATPQVARAINAMLQHKLIRYVNNESGAYLFAPVVPLKFLGLPVRYISGFDYEGFGRVPASRMVGTAPPVFLEVRVAASVEELRKRASNAGLVETVGPGLRPRLDISAEGLGSYLAPKSREIMSSAECAR